MIVVKFDGGLGNQMLQYACYVALQERYPHIQVVADIRQYSYSKVHNGLELDRVFPISLNVLFNDKETKILEIKKHRQLYRVINKAFKIGLNKFRVIKDIGVIRFVKDIGVMNHDLFHFDANKNYYLEGQWGNEKYFENAKEIIKQCFTFKEPLDDINQTEAKKFSDQNSVSVHIRRGDYISSESDFVDLSGSDYYSKAFNFLNKTTENPVFYIFSDDIEWCRENFGWLTNYVHFFIKGNEGPKSYKDMHLMSLCKHNIIANSTFSWWGAWLNNNPNKIVICPKKLFYDEIMNTKIVNEFYPETWIKM